jgi:hypothetical protein
MKKIPFLFILTFTALLLGEPFAPLTYTPPVKPIEIDPSKCGLQLYLSPTGNDSSSGRQPESSGTEGPFATLERARDEIRKLRKSGSLPPNGVAVSLRGGNYFLNHSFELTAEDSGTPAAPVIYQAWKGEAVHLLGGKKLTAKNFATISDPAKASRLNPTAVGKVLQLDLQSLGLTHAGPFPPVFSDSGGLFELFFNGDRMPLSRWPDEGYTTIKEVVTNGDKTIPGVFVYRDDRAGRWDPTAGLWLKGQWRVGWENPAIKVASIDTAKKEITFAAGLSSGIGNKYKRPKGSGEEPWYAINLLEEITRPGEWSIDFTQKILYFWPPAGFDQAEILISQLDQPLISAKNLSSTAFIGLTLENSLGDGIVASKGKVLLIAGCTIRNLAGNGVVLEGENCGVQSCDMFGLGKGCIVIAGESREALTPSGNYVVNNHLHHYGVLRSQYSAAVDLYYENKEAPAVGILVAHNLIHHAPRDGVLFAGNKNVFEYNEIHRCAYDTADSGAFYSWLDWTIRGIVIRYNYIHDTVGGVNPDDGSSGSFVYGNIFSGDRTGVWIASGPDHVIQKNIFIKTEDPVFGIDDRGASRGYATNKRLLEKVATLHVENPPWSEEFPEMTTLLQSRPELPLRTQFAGNVVWIKSGAPTIIKMKSENAKNPDLLKNEGNFVTDQDPGFVNLSSGDLNLKSDSPVFKNIPDFPKIPFEKIGLQIDAYRKKLPTPAEAGRLPEQNPWKPKDTDKNFGTEDVLKPK